VQICARLRLSPLPGAYQAEKRQGATGVTRVAGEIGRKTSTLNGGTLTDDANAQQKAFAVIRSSCLTGSGRA
jgi:hypothetical protein